jgi:hypothetical protein
MRRQADEFERHRMGEALEAAGGVKTHAPQLLGMPIPTFTGQAQAVLHRMSDSVTVPALAIVPLPMVELWWNAIPRAR